MNASDLYLNEHREYGQSTYSCHSDGSGVCYSSRLRPILNMRPKYRHWLSPSLWQFNADLHLTDWLEQMGFEFDVHTDEDLDREGVELLSRYRVVLTGSHPEYTSERMLNAYEAYQASGGRWMYLGAKASTGAANIIPITAILSKCARARRGHAPGPRIPVNITTPLMVSMAACGVHADVSRVKFVG